MILSSKIPPAFCKPLRDMWIINIVMKLNYLMKYTEFYVEHAQGGKIIKTSIYLRRHAGPLSMEEAAQEVSGSISVPVDL